MQRLSEHLLDGKAHALDFDRVGLGFGGDRAAREAVQDLAAWIRRRNVLTRTTGVERAEAMKIRIPTDAADVTLVSESA